LRIILESKLWDHNSFVTLTYNGGSLPADRSVHKDELQKFIKRLRKNSGLQFRYFAVGEYGDESGRAHYHLILFGFPYVYDEYVEKSWHFGISQTLPMEPGAAGYISGYVSKKLTKDDEYTREKLDGKSPEFSIMSRGRKTHPDYRFQGGIGYGYIRQIAKNIIRDKLSLVGDDHKYIRISGTILPLDKYMRDCIDKEIGFTKLEETLGKKVCISMKAYKDLNFPEAEEHEREKAARKARKANFLRKIRKKL
jgi:hypothetical protein